MPLNDPNRVYGGFSVLDGGMNGGVAASLIPENQCSASRDFTYRDGFIKTRPPYVSRVLTFADAVSQTNFAGKFQGAVAYQSEFGNDGFVISRGGRLFRLEIGNINYITEITPRINIVTTADFTVPGAGSNVNVSITSETIFSTGDTVYVDSGQYTVANRGTNLLVLTYVSGAANATATAGNAVLNSNQLQSIEYQTNPTDFDLVYMFQAENYIIALAGQHRPVIYDGTSARLAVNGEIPPGTIGVYLWGRIWITLPDRRTFVAGDIVFGPSGTPQNGYRDAILKFTENDFLNEGGSFGVPKNAGPITSMSALATQDTSLGVGTLLIGTPNMVFSVNTPVDRTTWKNLSYPIQTVSLIDYGPQGPRSTLSVNGDMWYRSLDGIRSFIVARREITSWGNTPMSREISPVLKYDSEDLLVYGSAIQFDNKAFFTISPSRTPNGVTHNGLAVINFDLLSSMRVKLPPSWEGAYTGLKILQVVKGTINESERAFAFALNGSTVELWELQKQGFYDVWTQSDGPGTSMTRVAIQPFIETRSDPMGDGTQLKNLYTSELFLDELVDNVTLVIKFRPDQYPGWTTWATLNLCANVSSCQVNPPGAFACSMWKTGVAQYAARILIPKPPEDCNTISSAPMSRGYEFQFRIEGTGHFRIRKFRPHAMVCSDKVEGSCPTSTCQTLVDCGTNWFNYNSHGN